MLQLIALNVLQVSVGEDQGRPDRESRVETSVRMCICVNQEVGAETESRGGEKRPGHRS